MGLSGGAGLRKGPPPLEELIARLIVQQREILTIARRIQADVRALGDRLPRGDEADRNGHTAPIPAVRGTEIERQGSDPKAVVQVLFEAG